MSKLSQMFKEVNEGTKPRRVKRNRVSRRNIREGKINEGSIKIDFPTKDLKKSIDTVFKRISNYFRKEHGIKTQHFFCNISFESHKVCELGFEALEDTGDIVDIYITWDNPVTIYNKKAEAKMYIGGFEVNRNTNRDLTDLLNKFKNDFTQILFLSALDRFIQHHDYAIFNSIQ